MLGGLAVMAWRLAFREAGEPLYEPDSYPILRCSCEVCRMYRAIIKGIERGEYTYFRFVPFKAERPE